MENSFYLKFPIPKLTQVITFVEKHFGLLIVSVSYKGWYSIEALFGQRGIRDTIILIHT